MASTLYKGRFNIAKEASTSFKPKSSPLKKSKQMPCVTGHAIKSKKSFARKDDAGQNTTGIKYIQHPLKMLVIKWIMRQCNKFDTL